MTESHITLSIADLIVEVMDDSHTPSEWLADRCRGHHSDRAARSNTTLVIQRRDDFTLGTDELVADLGTDAGGFTIRGYDFIARRRRCDLPVEVEAHPEAGMAGILRWVIGMLLIEEGGLLVHGMSYVFAGSGVLCAGPLLPPIYRAGLKDRMYRFIISGNSNLGLDSKARDSP